MRLGPIASASSVLWACGSHLAHSHAATSRRRPAPRRSARRDGGRRRRSRPWPGRGRGPGASSPVTSTRLKARRSTAAGRSGCTRCTTSSRCSAEAATGSSCSTGAVSGGTSSQGERLRGAAVAREQEVLVRPGRAPTAAGGPRPGRAAAAGAGWCHSRRAALLVGGLADHLADAGEVLEVLAARAGDLGAALLALAVDLHADEAEGGDEEHARGDDAPCRRAARRRRTRSSRRCRASAAPSSARRRRPRWGRARAVPGGPAPPRAWSAARAGCRG